MVAAADPHVVGGYVYFRLHGRWYRYDADPAAAHAHGVRLDGITPRAWFGGGTLLATHGDELDVPRWFPDRIELHRVAVRCVALRGYRARGRHAVCGRW